MNFLIKKSRILVWFILPVFFFTIATAFSTARGPFYLAYNYDPDYVYLLNGLNLAQFKPAYHIDHPGTPLQLGIAGIIRLKTLGVSRAETVDRVLAHSEGYLQFLNRLYLALYSLALGLVGWAVFKLTNNLMSGLLSQCAPFLLESNFSLFTRVNPEPLILLLALISIPLLVRLIQQDDPKNDVRFIVITSFLSATGLCAKITYLPALLVPWVIMTWRNKAIFGGCVCVFSVLWTLPILPRYGVFFEWLWHLFTRQGAYGRGSAGLINPDTYLAGVKTLLFDNKVFAATIFISLIVLLLHHRKRLPPGAASDRSAHFLAGLTFAQILQLMLCAKDPQSRYLVATQGLIVLNWIVMLLMVRGGDLKSHRIVRRTIQTVGVCLLLFAAVEMRQNHQQTQRRTAEKMSLVEKVRSYDSQCATIFCYGASSLVYALALGSDFAGSEYNNALDRLIQTEARRMYFLNIFSYGIYSLKRVVPLEQIMTNNTCVILHGDVRKATELLGWPGSAIVEKIGEAGNEAAWFLKRPSPPVSAIQKGVK